jgi:hypothetical protein
MSARTVTTERTERSRIRGSILSGERDYSILHSVQTGSESHAASYNWDLLPRGLSGRGVKLTTNLYLVKKIQLSLQQAVEAPTFSRQSAHRWQSGCQPYPQEHSWYVFLLEAE